MPNDAERTKSGPERKRDPEWAEAMIARWERPVSETEDVLRLARNGTAMLVHDALVDYLRRGGQTP